MGGRGCQVMFSFFLFAVSDLSGFGVRLRVYLYLFIVG